jgi:hypothetical protein
MTNLKNLPHSPLTVYSRSFSAQPDLGVVGQFLGAASGTNAQVTFRQRLESPGNLADEIRLVPGPRLFPEHLGVPFAQLVRRHVSQRCDLPFDVNLHGKVLRFSGALTADTTRHTEPRFARNLKARFAIGARFFRSLRTGPLDHAVVAQKPAGENGGDLGTPLPPVTSHQNTMPLQVGQGVGMSMILSSATSSRCHPCRPSGVVNSDQPAKSPS